MAHVLFVDFGTSQLAWPMAALKETAARHGTWQLVNPLAHAPLCTGHVPLQEQASHWAGVVSASPPTHVVGYCSGALLATAIGEALDRPAEVIVFDPAAASPDDVAEILAGQVALY